MWNVNLTVSLVALPIKQCRYEENNPECVLLYFVNRLESIQCGEKFVLSPYI